MKASEPGSESSHGLKYGLPPHEQPCIVELHNVVMQERIFFRELNFAYAVRIGPGLSAAVIAALRR